MRARETDRGPTFLHVFRGCCEVRIAFICGAMCHRPMPRSLARDLKRVIWGRDATMLQIKAPGMASTVGNSTIALTCNLNRGARQSGMPRYSFEQPLYSNDKLHMRALARSHRTSLCYSKSEMCCLDFRTSCSLAQVRWVQ